MPIRAYGLLLALVAVGACSSSTAPMSASPSNLAGSWLAFPNGIVVPGPVPAGFVLSQTGESVTGAWSSGGFPTIDTEVYAAVRGRYVRPNIVLVLTDTAGKTGVDTVTGVAKTTTTIVVAGITYYKQ